MRKFWWLQYRDTGGNIQDNEVSKEMEYLLREKSKSSLKTRNAYALLNASGTTTLSLDGYLKWELSQPMKAADKELASSVGVTRY